MIGVKFFRVCEPTVFLGSSSPACLLNIVLRWIINFCKIPIGIWYIKTSGLLSVLNGNFQIISGIHVFDHLISPLKYLSKLDIFVESGSYIYSVTHNERSLLRQLMRKHWIPFCLQHPQLYNPKTLEFLFGKLGFELVSCKPTVNWFPINHILTVFTRLLSSKIKVENNLFDYSIPIKLGNIQAIFRKK